MSFRYNENDLNIASGLLQLDENALIPSNKLPTTLSYQDKQLVYFGEIQTLSSSQYWKPLRTIYINEVSFELQNTPTGNGSTVFKLIRNNDLNDTLFTATFNPGDLIKSFDANIQIDAYDKVSLAITSVTDGFHGSDLQIFIYFGVSAD
jgi:hypothetical protein